jgi:hypothetical protein
MKLTLEQFNKINETHQYIIDSWEYFREYEEELIYTEEAIEEFLEDQSDFKELPYCFPGEGDYVYIEINEFFRICDEIKHINIVNRGYVKTNLHNYYIVGLSNLEDEVVLRDYHNIQTIDEKTFSIRLVNESFIVGLAAVDLDAYEENLDIGAITSYLAIEIVYSNEKERLDFKEEKKIIESYIFEIADSTGIALFFSEMNGSEHYDLEAFEEGLNYTEHLRKLEPYNDGMKLFVSAIQINDLELKFFNFYKVLEHFSPIAANLEANELMRKKLDAPRSAFENGDFIRSIFDLAISIKDKFNDEDLIKTCFNICFDFVGLYKLLPESIKKKIKQQLKIQELTYSTNQQKILSAANLTAKIIYKTRNMVVHAKSNFKSTGEEIQNKELLQLNVFMKAASSQAIRWYSRQPNHLKMDLLINK